MLCLSFGDGHVKSFGVQLRLQSTEICVVESVRFCVRHFLVHCCCGQCCQLTERALRADVTVLSVDTEPASRADVTVLSVDTEPASLADVTVLSVDTEPASRADVTMLSVDTGVTVLSKSNRSSSGKEWKRPQGESGLLSTLICCAAFSPVQ